MQVKFEDELSTPQNRPLADPSLQPLKLHHLAHDLRGPLNSILGFAELLMEGIEGPVNDIQAEDLAAIRQSAQNLFRLINNIVDLSKLNDDRLILAFEAVNINRLINKTITEEFSSQQDKFVMVLPETPCLVWGDPERVAQILHGLINFIYKQKPTGQITIDMTCDDSFATIQIKTAAIWLTSQQTDLLFVPITRINEAGRSELGTGGVELPLIRQLAEKHNGQLRVESNESIGISFFLRLPLHVTSQ